MIREKLEYQPGGLIPTSPVPILDVKTARAHDNGRRVGGGNPAHLRHHLPVYSSGKKQILDNSTRHCRLRRNLISVIYGIMLGLFVWFCVCTLSFSCCVVGVEEGGMEIQQPSLEGNYRAFRYHTDAQGTLREVTLTRNGQTPLQDPPRRDSPHHLSRKLEEDDMIYNLPYDQDIDSNDDLNDSPYQHRKRHSSNRHKYVFNTNLHIPSEIQLPTNSREFIYDNHNQRYDTHIKEENSNNSDDDNYIKSSDNDIINNDNQGDISDDKYDTRKPTRRKNSKDNKNKYHTDSLTRSKQGYNRRLPNALIIGVKKGGTRALLEFLRVHPDIRAPGPEPHFFDRNYEKGLDWYRRQMPPTLDGQLTIEKSPSYFVTKGVPGRIYNMSRDTKLLIVVRDPVTRAISDYTQSASKRPDIKPFEQMAFLDNKTGLVDTSWGAVKIGVYARHLERWLRFFPLEQIHFVNGEKLISNPAKELEKVQDFLGLKRVITEKHFYFNSTRGFPCLKKPEGSGNPHCLGKTKGRPHPKVDPKVIKRLHDFFRPFNAKFYQMTGIDFGWP